MSDNWQQVNSPVSGLGVNDGGSANTSFAPTTEDELAAGTVTIPDAVPGRLGVAVLGQYVPETTHELVWTDKQPTEVWPTGAPEPMLNMGPHRVAVVDAPVVFDLDLHGARSDAWSRLGGPLDWDWGDGTVEVAGVRHEHAYAAPGLYRVTVTTAAGSGFRWVRVFATRGESDLEVVGLENFAGALKAGGWQATLVVAGDVSMLSDGTHVAVYADDALDIGWRYDYEARMRDLAVRQMWNTKPPPDPNYKVDSKGNPIGEAVPEKPDTKGLAGSNGLGVLGGDFWGPVDRWDLFSCAAADAFAVPVNLVKSVVQYYSGGNPSWLGQTDSLTCGTREGLMGAHDCFFTDTKGMNRFDPKGNIYACVRELRVWFETCDRSWWRAINGYLTLTCTPTGTYDYLGREDFGELRLVLRFWNDLDTAALPTTEATAALALAIDQEVPLDFGQAPPPPPPSLGVAQLGQTLFSGYVTKVTLVEDSGDHDVHRVELSGAQGHLAALTRRAENFWEQKDGIDSGGTFPTGGNPPMRIPDLIYHVVAHHTDWARRFDLALDFTTARSSSISLPEGQLMGGFQQWAENDFGNCFVGRWGGLRYTSQPSFLGERWWTQAYSIAPVWRGGQILEATVTERNLDRQVTWVKLGGYGKHACAQFGEHPCGGPPEGSGGRWIFEQGLWYDDSEVLCAMAAHAHAWENRRYDVELRMPYRPDLELGDLFRLPLVDPNGRFDWRVHHRLFEVIEVAHKPNLMRGTWETTVKAEQVTYGLPCHCPRRRCPTTVWDDPANPPPNPWPGGGFPGGDFPGPNFPGGGFPWPGSPGSGSPAILATINGRVRYTSAGNGRFHEAWTDDVSGERAELYSEKARGYKDWGRVTQTTCLVVTVKGLGYQPLVLRVRPGTGTMGTTDIGDHTNYLHKSVANTRADLRVLRVHPVDDLSAYLQQQRPTPLTPDATGGPNPLGPIDPAPLPEGIDGAEAGGLGELAHTPEGYPVLGTIPGTALPYLGRYGVGLPAEGDIFWDSPLLAHAGELAGTYIVAEDEGAPGAPIGIGDGLLDGTAGPDPFGAGAGASGSLAAPLDPSAPLPGQNRGSGYLDPGAEDNVANTGWREYRLYLAADLEGRSYLIGFAVVSPGKATGEDVVVPLAPSATSPGAPPSINSKHQPFTAFEIGALRVDLQAVWGTPTYDPVRGDSFGGEAGDNQDVLDELYGQENWPTAEAIDIRIAAAEQRTGRGSKLDGAGPFFLQIGAALGVNPALVAALAYYQSHLGADGSQLAVMYNNFFALAGAGTCGEASLGDATGGPSGYAAYCEPLDGLAAGFAWVDGVRAAETVGAVLAALGLAQAQATIEAVGAAMGVNLAAGAGAFSEPGGPARPRPANGPGAGGYATMLEYALHQAGGRVTQGPYEGPTHTAVDAYDIAVPEGTPLYPLVGGTVIETGFDAIYGNYVDVITPYGVIREGHLSVIQVANGSPVSAGTQIGLSGNTGSSTGPHLHIELRGASGLNAIMTQVGFNIGAFM